MEKSGRIGIFQYDWSMYSFIKVFIIKLAEAGYMVDVFQKDPNTSVVFADTEAFKVHSNIRYFTFSNSNTLAQISVRKFMGVLRRVSRKVAQNRISFIDSHILRISKDIIRKSAYQCFIGIEKKGLIWAGCLAQTSRCPLIYYSLELYCEDHPDIKEYSYLRKEEKRYHRRSLATIIQDKLRAQALLEYNEIANTNVIYFPISVKGAIVKKKSDFFHRKYKLNKAMKVLLYFGLIQNERFSSDLVRMAGHMKGEKILVLHGYGDQAYLTHLRSTADRKRVILSLELVPEEQIVDIISSATIGLALYENSSSNDRLAAFSSVKVAYYLQCGVPIIAFYSESFRELVSAYKCGELINSIDEIPKKAEMILQNYDNYVEQACLAFKQFYDYDCNFKKFIVDYDALINDEDWA